MKVLKYISTSRFDLIEMDKPSPRKNEVLIEVYAAGICGSEINGFKGKSDRHKPPLVLGHEIVGIIKDPGNSNLQSEEKVVVNPLLTCGTCEACLNGRENICVNRKLIGVDLPGGYAEFVAVPSSAALSLPNETELEKGLLIEPLANIVHLFKKINIRNSPRIMIIGAGLQGLLALLYAKTLDDSECGISDINSERLNFALTLGADSIINPKETTFEERYYDIVIDAVGSNETRSGALKAVKNGGSIYFFGMHEKITPLDCYSIVAREIDVHGTVLYSKEDFANAVAAVNNHSAKLNNMITEFPLSEGQKVFERLSTNPGNVIKAVLMH